MFGFSDFMRDFDNITEVPIKMVDESVPVSDSNNQYQTDHPEIDDSRVDNSAIEASKHVNSKINDSKIEESKIEDSKIEDSKIENSKIEDSKIEDSKLENSKNSTGEQNSKNYTLIVDILKSSQDIENDLQDNLDSLDIRKATKKLKYAAENQYKLLEKLDMIQCCSEEKIIRKSAVKMIQKRLDSTDVKLAELENW